VGRIAESRNVAGFRNRMRGAIVGDAIVGDAIENPSRRASVHPGRRGVICARGGASLLEATRDGRPIRHGHDLQPSRDGGAAHP